MLYDKFNDYKVALVQNVEDMTELFRNLDKNVMVGIDTETTGLDYNLCHTVGYCISCGKSYSPNDYVGYYLPIRHLDESQNLPIERVVKLTQHIMDNYKTIFFNRNFDFHFMEKDGVTFNLTQKWHDSQMMAYNACEDQESQPSLKKSAKKYLKRLDGSPFDVIEYDANGAVEGSFATVDPRVGFKYAGGDPIMTCLLGRFLWKKFPEIHDIYTNIDNRFLEAIRYFNENAEIYFDYDLVNKLANENLRDIHDAEQKVYDYTGFEFKISSPKQLADALIRCGVKLTEKTESGAWSTSSETLEKIDHPMAKLVVNYGKLCHLKSNYLDKIKSYKDRYGDHVRVAYKACMADTGRLSCGSDAKFKKGKHDTFFADLNMQGIKKMEVFKYLHEDEKLGYYLDMNREGAVGRIKTKGGLRDAFVAPKGWSILGADFSAEELRVAANYSREPNLVTPILNGEDIHKYTAIKMFGHYEKCHRTKAKSINFLVLYGGSAPTLATRLNVSKKEAQDMFDLYFRTMKMIKKWIDSTIAQAKRDGMLKSAFGRPRHLAKLFNSPDSGMRAYAERLCVNFLCQGTGGDIIRMVLIRLHNRFLNDKEFAENVRFMATIHDEVQLLVKDEYLSKASKILCDCMYFKPEGFVVPICAEPMCGKSWGTEIECKEIVDNKIVLSPDDIEPLVD